MHLVQRVVGLPEQIPMRRLRRHRPLVPRAGAARPGPGSTTSSRSAAASTSSGINDPLNPKLSYSPVGTSSVCFAHGYETPEWTEHDPDARPGELDEIEVPSRALRRDCPVTLYLPARFRRTVAYPLLVVHDGRDFLQYAAAKTVLDNLIHRLRGGRDGGRLPAPEGPADRVRRLDRRTPAS